MPTASPANQRKKGLVTVILTSRCHCWWNRQRRHDDLRAWECRIVRPCNSVCFNVESARHTIGPKVRCPMRDASGKVNDRFWPRFPITIWHVRNIVHKEGGVPMFVCISLSVWYFASVLKRTFCPTSKNSENFQPWKFGRLAGSFWKMKWSDIFRKPIIS